MDKFKEEQIREFLNSDRYKYIKIVRNICEQAGICKEKVEGRCMYSHCGCLYDKCNASK